MRITLRLTEVEFDKFKQALVHYRCAGPRLDTSIEHFVIDCYLALIKAHEAKADLVLHLEGRE